MHFINTLHFQKTTFSRKMSNVHAFVMVHVNPNVLRVSVTTYVNIIMGILERNVSKGFWEVVGPNQFKTQIEEAMEAI